MKNKHRTRAEILALLSEWKRSGLSLHAFAKSKSLVYGTMLRWKNRLLPPASDAKSIAVPAAAAPDIAPAFVPVELLRSDAASSDIEIELSSGTKLRVPATIAEESLARVLRALNAC